MRILVTGGDGFLGWHTHVRLRALTPNDVVVVNRRNWHKLDQFIKGVDAVIHCAGVNRASPHQVEFENVKLAEDLALAVKRSGSSPSVVYANSIHAGADNAYGRGKAAASYKLADAVTDSGGAYTDVKLPNLFGEHGRPNYNSFVATFVDATVNGATPQINDREVQVLHAQNAAQALIDGLEIRENVVEPAGTLVRVSAVFESLRCFRQIYAEGDIPRLETQLDIDLFNTLRAAMFPRHYPIPLKTHSDNRGQLVEIVRSHGGQGQTFISTTKPGITRGEHFHLSKIERFVVVSGQARISLRRICTNETVTFDVDGRTPTIVDMPTLWAHNICNTGSDELVTIFWTNRLFDANNADTYPESVSVR